MKRFFTLVCLLLPVVAAGRVSGSPGLSPEVVEALDRNGRSLVPLVVRTDEGARTALSRAELARRLGHDMPVELILATSRHVSAFDAAGRLYHSHRRTNPPEAAVNESAFDGSIRAVGTVYPDDADHGIDPALLTLESPTHLAARAPLAPLFRNFHLENSGFDVTCRPADVIAAKLPRSLILHLLDHDGELLEERRIPGGNGLIRVRIRAPRHEFAVALRTDLETIERHLERARVPKDHLDTILDGVVRMRSLAVPVVYTFTLDPRFNFAVTEIHEQTEDGKTIARVFNSEFQQLGDRGIWLPGKSRRQQHDRIGFRPDDVIFPEPLVERHATVSSLETSASRAMFTLNYSIPGTRITDRTGGTVSERVVPAGADGLDATIGQVLTRRGTGWGGWGWAVVLTVAAVCAAGALVAWVYVTRVRRTRGA